MFGYAIPMPIGDDTQIAGSAPKFLSPVSAGAYGGEFSDWPPTKATTKPVSYTHLKP